MLTDEQLAEWERLANEAMPGPWECDYSSGSVNSCAPQFLLDDEGPLWVADYGSTANEQNGEFIAAAREAVPELIAEVRRLREQCKLLLDALDWHANETNYSSYYTDGWCREHAPIDEDQGQRARETLEEAQR